MLLKPWYKIEGLTPREDLRNNRPLDASEFAVNLDHVRENRAPIDYQDPEKFLSRTYLTRWLAEFAGQVMRRLSGVKTEANAVYNLATQFGGGKTHALALLYHLAQNGQAAESWSGVRKIIAQADIKTLPTANVAVFVGTEFDSLTGRGGNDGTPLRKTPWGEIAFQLGGEEAFKIVAQHDAEFTEPKGDVIRAFLPKDKPCLILMDEILNYVSSYRKYGYHDRLYNFMQALSETARGEDHIVLIASIPASVMEYTAADEADEQRFKKMLDRVGKAVVMSAEAEASEIIRRRLFEWDERAVTAEGKIILPKEAIATCNEYADWAVENRSLLPSWFPIDNAREAFAATYPFHPTVISVFERKWAALPRFQRTRGILRLLALWVSHAYQEGYKGNHKDALITLGTAPLNDPIFRSAVFEQMGEGRLETAVTTDICGKKDSHAFRLDLEATEAIKNARLHGKAATTIFFESNGGVVRETATLPEVRLAIADSSINIGDVETVLDTLKTDCYYLIVESTKYHFSLSPNLNKILADRLASVQTEDISKRIENEIKKAFPSVPGVDVSVRHFPKQSSEIPNVPKLTLAVLSIERPMSDANTLLFVEKLIRESGTSDRTYKSAVIFAIADSENLLRDEARKVLAWENIRDQEWDTLNDVQQKQLSVNLKKAERDVQEAVWRSYKYTVLLDKDNQLRTVDMGAGSSSSADNSKSITALILNRLKIEDTIQNAIAPRFLVRNWSLVFKEWSTKAIRDVFFSSPSFPRLLNGNAIKETIVKGVKEGSFAYVGKASDGKYQPFYFKDSPLDIDSVEISDDIYLIKGEDAEKYQKEQEDPSRLTTLEITPTDVTLKPNQGQTFTVKGVDQRHQNIAIANVLWTATGGNIDEQGMLIAGEITGNFTVNATVGAIANTVSFTIEKETVPSNDTPAPDGDEKKVVPTPPNQLKWSGEVTPQKWTQFYTKVLSKFSATKDLKLKLKVEVVVDGEISEQKIEETKVALQELGLDSDIQTH
ncbi:ATP-binding protein [Planktothrix agardhii]|jgi:hypothetical protein|uniref:ATP-binding protein n=1 Tax=Planktothrix agardhii TaxID=1160 RepID=UPI001D0A99ED|nr:DUF499 domain-containing protein [Planktothrix agardhii]MCB8762026.1 DUF499 domain-containing protein [Planktothrix agardhii 1813]